MAVKIVSPQGEDFPDVPHVLYRHAVFYGHKAEISVKPGETASLVTATGASKRDIVGALDAVILGLIQLRSFVQNQAG